MDEKISQKAIAQYSEAYASKIISTFFSTKDKITGPEILELCDVRQVNLFVLRELMHAWRVESQRLKSPYFDYQAKEVTESMRQFQNTLSNHIAISQPDFSPLLANAVSQTLYVVLTPYDFYSNTLDRQGQGTIQVSDLKNDIKYLKINRPPMEKLIQKLDEKKLTSLSGNEAFALLDSILEEVNFTPEDIDSYIEQFSKVVPLEISRLYEAKGPLIAKAPVTTPPIEKKVEAQAVAKPAANNFTRVNRIKNNLTINQKFMFTKILFKGDFEVFSQAIEKLDALDNLGQALEFVDTHHAEWDRESEEFVEFRTMLERRFAM